MLPQIRHWVRWPVLLFAATVLMGLVAAHTSLVQPHELAAEHRFDTAVRTGALTVAAKAIAEIAGPAGGLVLLVLWCGWLLVVRRRPARAAAVFTIVLVGWNISEIAKIIVARHRPPTVWSLAPETGSNSFPSGHTAFTTACVLAAWFLVRGTRRERPVAVLGTLAVIVVAVSRVYMGVHYPTDVLGGVLVSASGVLFTAGLWNTRLLPGLHRVPLLDRFGDLEPPAEVPRQHRAGAHRRTPDRRPAGRDRHPVRSAR